MTNKETTNMNSTEVELKAIAKAIGGSLKRAGHAVPHTTVLHAVSAALDKRDWHKVKAALTTPVAGPVQGSNAFDAVPPQYSERTLFALRLAFACGAPVLPVPADDGSALAAARAAFPPALEGVLSWQGWNVPVSMNPATSSLDAGDFKPETPSLPGCMTLRLAAIEETLSLEVAYSESDGSWYLTQGGAAQAYRQLEEAVPLAKLFPPVLPGDPVKAEFWTDDRVVEAHFDARAYLMQASAADIKAIIDCGYRGDYPTDHVAQYMADKALDEDIEAGFEYIGALQKAGRKDAPGFECSVDKDSLLQWLDAHRPEALALALCDKADVGLSQAEEDEIRGMWDWISPDGSQACEHSFDTREQAALDAYYVLGLLQQEQDGAL